MVVQKARLSGHHESALPLTHAPPHSRPQGRTHPDDGTRQQQQQRAANVRNALLYMSMPWWLGRCLVPHGHHASFISLPILTHSPFRALTDLVLKGGVVASALFGGSLAGVVAGSVGVVPGTFGFPLFPCPAIPPTHGSPPPPLSLQRTQPS